MNSDFSIPFGKELPKDNELVDNKTLDEMDDMFDTFNDETFGDMSTDWESEHEKLMSFTQESQPIDPKNDSKANVSRNSYMNDNRTDEECHYGWDDNISKSIFNLGLEDEDIDEDFDDPAIMTFARSAKPLNIKPMADPIQALNRSSPPPPAILSYEEYSASPQTQSIWSRTQMDSSLNQNISSPKMTKLEDIENEMIIRNADQMIRLSTIKRPIRVEDLEADLMLDSANGQLGRNAMPVPEKGWSPFASNSMHRFIPNGEIPSDKDLRADFESNRHILNRQIERESPIQPMQSLDDRNKPKVPFDPLLKAQTLSDIERQLILSQSPPQRPKMSPNVTQSHAQTHPIRPNIAPIAVSPVRPFGHQINQMGPQMWAQNRMNNIYSVRPPVMHLRPGMHPAIGRSIFAPALIPNSQRIFPFPRPVMHPLLHPLHIQQQQHINQMQRHSIQAQHNRQSNQYNENNFDDEYSGLMTNREKEWLIKIQQMQTELKDPYVDDYYYVTYSSRKIAAKLAKDKDNKTLPLLLLPERPKPVTESENVRYIPEQFEGTLGKIHASNVNCPRKLLDCKVNKTDANPNDTQIDNRVINKSEVQRFRKLLLEIEKLYVVLINIDDEDKRIGALPEVARLPHLETRKQLCEQLFRGLTNETNDKINLEVKQIRKGLILTFRSLSYLSDETQRTVILSDLLNSNNFRQFVIKSKTRLDFGQLFVNAFHNIKNHENLLKIVANINNISIIIKSEFGQQIIEAIVNQCEKLEIKDENKTKWSIFVNNVLDELVDDMTELKTLCLNHLKNSCLF